MPTCSALLTTSVPSDWHTPPSSQAFSPTWDHDAPQRTADACVVHRKHLEQQVQSLCREIKSNKVQNSFILWPSHPLPVQYSLPPACGTTICLYTTGLASKMFSSCRYRKGVWSCGVPRDLAPFRCSDVSISEKTAALSKRARFPSKSKSVSRPSSTPSPKHSSSLCFIWPFFTPFFFGVIWFGPRLLDDPGRESVQESICLGDRQEVWSSLHKSIETLTGIVPSTKPFGLAQSVQLTLPKAPGVLLRGVHFLCTPGIALWDRHWGAAPLGWCSWCVLHTAIFDF